MSNNMYEGVIPIKDKFGTLRWYNSEFQLIKIDIGGTVKYYQDGYLHRDGDLPAVILAGSNVSIWYQNNKKSRGNDQPAVVIPDGENEYWLNGVRQEPPEEMQNFVEPRRI